MHPHDILVGVVVVYDLWPLHDPIGSEVSGVLDGQQFIDKFPLYEVLNCQT